MHTIAKVGYTLYISSRSGFIPRQNGSSAPLDKTPPCTLVIHDLLCLLQNHTFITQRYNAKHTCTIHTTTHGESTGQKNRSLAPSSGSKLLFSFRHFLSNYLSFASFISALSSFFQWAKVLHKLIKNKKTPVKFFAHYWFISYAVYILLTPVSSLSKTLHHLILFYFFQVTIHSYHTLTYYFIHSFTNTSQLCNFFSPHNNSSPNLSFFQTFLGDYQFVYFPFHQFSSFFHYHSFFSIHRVGITYSSILPCNILAQSIFRPLAFSRTLIATETSIILYIHYFVYALNHINTSIIFYSILFILKKYCDFFM